MARGVGTADNGRAAQTFDGCERRGRALARAWSMSLCLAGLVFSHRAPADSGWSSIGASGGWSLTAGGQGFEQYELDAAYQLPWQWRPCGHTQLSTRVDLTAGMLRQGNTQSFLAAAGPALELQWEGIPIALEGGVSLTLLSLHAFPEEDLGGPVQFISHLGLNVLLGRYWVLGYRAQHMSNADIYSHNHGLNMQMIALGYRF
jgi:lipid A 3-O-deacylase